MLSDLPTIPMLISDAMVNALIGALAACVAAFLGLYFLVLLFEKLMSWSHSALSGTAPNRSPSEMFDDERAGFFARINDFFSSLFSWFAGLFRGARG